MQQVDGVQQQRGANRPGHRHRPAATTVVLRASPHRTLNGEGDEQAEALNRPQDRFVCLVVRRTLQLDLIHH